MASAVGALTQAVFQDALDNPMKIFSPFQRVAMRIKKAVGMKALVSRRASGRSILIVGVLIIVCWQMNVSSIYAQDPIEKPETSEDSDIEGRYLPPDLKSRLFSVDVVAISQSVRRNLLTMLTSMAVNEKTPMLLKTRALGIALRLDPTYDKAILANFSLQNNQVPETADNVAQPYDFVVSNTLRLAKSVATAELQTDDNLILAVHLLDLVRTMDPANVDCAYAIEVLETHGIKVNWRPISGEAGKGGHSSYEIIGGTAPGSGKTANRMQAQIKRLLERPPKASELAGKASQMSATVTPVETGTELMVTFKQDVGPSLNSALNEVVKFLRVRHKRLPGDGKVEILFDEDFIPTGEPSAAMACALMLESLISDTELDHRFAVTGDLNADGRVQPAGGVVGMLRGTAVRECNVVAIPLASRRDISDMVIVDGPEALVRTQIFGIETFDDALELARVHDQRSENIRHSIEEFERIREVLTRPDGMGMLKNSHVQDKLRECIKLTPNHFSAKQLLLSGLGQSEKHLSLKASVVYLERVARPALGVAQLTSSEMRATVDADDFVDAEIALRPLHSRLNLRTRKISDSIVDLARLIKTFANNEPTSRKGRDMLFDEILSAGEAVENAFDKLTSSVSYQEEMMK